MFESGPVAEICISAYGLSEMDARLQSAAISALPGSQTGAAFAERGIGSIF